MMKSAIRMLAVLALPRLIRPPRKDGRLPFRWRLAQATKGLRSIRNHLDVDPKAKIIAVAHAEAWTS
jgi:hypothetical protein